MPDRTETRSSDDEIERASPATPALPVDEPSRPALAAGDCLGRYTVRARLGAGAMGEVFAAHDPELDRLVALKILQPGIGGGSPKARVRFQREAQAMARLSHPNVVSVFDVATVGERVFVAMELVHGPTLAEWIAERPHPWRDVVAVFLQAGRGLEAAHAAGIVHRDFKPANVILGDRVRVVDFGLARAVYEPSPGPALTPLEGVVTQTGQMVGTPAYMAPEQRAGAAASPLSDQYSFAVALHEALFGARPGEAAPARGVPGHLRAVVERGLRPRPEDRYPSMRELLADLARDPARARRRWLAAAAVAILVPVALLARSRMMAPRCDGAEALIAPLWDDAARTRVAQAFRATGRAYAADTFDRVDASLRARQGAWARAHREACEATQDRHEQSDAMLDLRMRCLSQAKAEMGALVSALGRADAAALDRAAQAAAQIGDLAACADTAALAAAVPPPRDAATAAEVEALRRDLARLAALRTLGQWKEGLAVGSGLVERARRVGYPPVLAQALGATGWFGIAARIDVDRAIETLYEAAGVGAASKDDAIVAAAYTDLVYALGEGEQRFDAADVAYRAAVAAIARAGNGPKLLASVYGFRAHALDRKGDSQSALPLRILVLALGERLYGPDSGEVGTALMYLATTLSDVGRVGEALPFYDRALAITENAVGPEHPRIAILLYNAAVDHLRAGDPDRAAAMLERALALDERNFGPDSVQVAKRAGGLAEARIAQRRLSESRLLIERAIRIRVATLGAEHPDLALEYLSLGDALRIEGKPDEAHRMNQTALAILRKFHGAASHPSLALASQLDTRALLDLGRVKEARVAAEQAIALDEKTIGADHPDHGDSLRALADVLCAEGRCAEAVPPYRRALALAERKYGGAGPRMAEPLLGLCRALVETGDGPGAAHVARRAVDIAAQAPPDVRAQAQLCLAQAEWLSPGDRAAALARAGEARARLAALPYAARELRRVDDWLARAGSRR